MNFSIFDSVGFQSYSHTVALIQKDKKNEELFVLSQHRQVALAVLSVVFWM